MSSLNTNRLEKLMREGEPLMVLAIEALRQYQGAKGVLAANQVNRLREEAEFLFSAVQAYQLRVLGGAAPALH